MNKVEIKTEINEYKCLKGLQGLKCGERFIAKDLGVSGMTLKNMDFKHYFKIVGDEDVWYRIDENTLKKGTRHIYERTDKKVFIYRTLEQILQDELRYERNHLKKCQENIAYLENLIKEI